MDKERSESEKKSPIISIHEETVDICFRDGGMYHQDKSGQWWVRIGNDDYRQANSNEASIAASLI